MSPAAILSVSALVLAALFVALWLASLRLHDASVVDPCWGPAFALVAWVALALGPAPDARAWLLAALVTVWGGRLGAHLLRRWRAHSRSARTPGGGEDRRYRAMRERRGAGFARWSLYAIFLAQAALAWFVSLPLQAALGWAPRAPLGGLGVAGVALFGVGLLFEVVGDAQLARFLAEPGSAGRVMDRGLWRYTRHPNYFGDFLVWWGLGLLSAEVAGAWVLVGPALMSFLLLRVSGVALLESTIGTRRPEYAEYVRRTSAFFPRPPRRPRRPAARAGAPRASP